MYKLFGLVCALLIGYLDPVWAQDPIVYARCARTTATFELLGDVTINGTKQNLARTMTGLDIYDILPDVTNFFDRFIAPCDLVLRQPNGDEIVIYDCSSTSTDASSCAALDPAVSFDGKKIAFSVFRGPLQALTERVHSQVLHPKADNSILGTIKLPSKRLLTDGAHIHIYDIASGQVNAFPYVDGVIDGGPTFISNTRLAFTSNRDGHTATLIPRGNSSRVGSRIWNVDIDGNNPDLASHHSLSREEHPFMLKDGRLAYSSWQIFGTKPFKYSNGSVGGVDTLDNLFHIYTQAPDGAGNFAFFGQHSGDHRKSYFGAFHDAAHFITQTSDERVWFADYYRANNKGLGLVIGVMPEPFGQEGIHPNEATTIADIYVPRDVINFAAWSTNSDQASRVDVEANITHPSYTDILPWVGKVGYPAALNNNGLMVSWGKGACSIGASGYVFSALGRVAPPKVSGAGQGVAMNMMTSLGLDTPGCDVGIYRATQIPSQSPKDLEMIVDSPDWHEIMARAVVPYSAIHGVDAPEVIERADKLVSHPELPTGTPFGLLGAASIIDRETHPRDGIQFRGLHQFNLQGTDTINYEDKDLCGIRMLGVMPNRNRNTYRDIANLTGERVAILGEIPVKNKDTQGNDIIDPSGNPDTSFLLSMPANVPYLMQGIDCEGRTLNTDQTWQHLRPGEMKTCGGCHVHSKESRIKFEQSFAATNNYKIPKLGRGSVPLIDGSEVEGYGMQIEFTKDIKPIFDQHCISCHAGTNAAGIDLSKTQSNNNVVGETWWCLVFDVHQACLDSENRFDTGRGRNNISFDRPQASKYIRALNSLGSLLYWKAANKRTDRNTDSQFSDDIDFGADHPTNITKKQLGLLSRWIDLGSPGGAKELLDTQKPTLHLAANVQNNAITELRIGTVDLGSGINPASLSAKVNNRRLPVGEAALHGITTVVLVKPITDPNVKIEVRAKDKQGNETVVIRTARWFLGAVI